MSSVTGRVYVRTREEPTRETRRTRACAVIDCTCAALRETESRVWCAHTESCAGAGVNHVCVERLWECSGARGLRLGAVTRVALCVAVGSGSLSFSFVVFSTRRARHCFIFDYSIRHESSAPAYIVYQLSPPAGPAIGPTALRASATHVHPAARPLHLCSLPSALACPTPSTPPTQNLGRSEPI